MFCPCQLFLTFSKIITTSYQVKLDDWAERNLANFGMKISEGSSVALQRLDNPQQGSIDGWTRNFSAQHTSFARDFFRFFAAFTVIYEFGVVTENGYAGEIFPWGSAQIKRHCGRAFSTGINFSNVIVQPDVGHSGLVFGQSAGLVTQ